MTSRAGLRLLQSGAYQPLRTSFRQPLQRRFQTTVAEPPAQSGFQKLWNSPVGPKTVHFWAPIMKWGIVLAGISDFTRPADKLSLQQNLALMATGVIWTRWCLIIKPKNVFLATVNFFMFLVGTAQVTRVFMYNRSLKNQTPVEGIKAAGTDVAQSVEGAAKDAKAEVKQALK